MTRDNDPNRMDGPGVEPGVGSALDVIDPASRDPQYWFRFRGRVLTAAARELARRRLMAELTVAEVMTSWARMVVPTAAVAAAVAGAWLMRGPDRIEVPLGVEELLVSEVPSESVPVLLSPDEDAGVVAFASEVF